MEVDTKLLLVSLILGSQNEIVWHDTSWRGMVLSSAQARKAMLLYTLAVLNRGDCCIWATTCFNIRTSALCLCGVLMHREIKLACLAINVSASGPYGVFTCVI
jgi:hypothetical protein